MENLCRCDIVNVDITKSLKRSYVGIVLATGDNNANKFGVNVYKDGEPLNMTGYSVLGYFIRPDMATLIVTGEAEGNTAYVYLPAACYAYEGAFSLAIKISGADITQTVRVIDGCIRLTQTDTLVDPGEVIPSLDELFAKIADMEAATEAANTAAAAADAAREGIQEDLTGMSESIEEIAPASVNLFDPEDPEIIMDAYQSGSNIVDSAGLAVTGYIRCDPGTVLTATYLSGVGVNNAMYCYDESKAFATVVQGVLSEDGASAAYTIADDRTRYVRLNIQTTAISSYMVVAGEAYPTEYVPHGRSLSDKMQKQVIQAVAAEMVSNPLRGKILAVNGDSICYGAGYAGGYAGIIAGQNDMVLENTAVSGASITAEQYFSTGAARHWICRTIENMREDADYIILEGGVNDSSIAAPMGEITSKYSIALDDTTYYGAFESMLKQLVTRFAGKKYGYIAVHKMTANYDSRNEEGNSYYWAAKRCCEKWGVPFLDLNIAVPPFAHYVASADESLQELRTTYTLDGDGWHPNEEGYKRYYCDKIEAWMRTL